jgi:DNA primase catalytic core
MAPRSGQAQPGRQSREQDRQLQVAALRDRLDVQLRSLVTGEDWAAWLRLAARLPDLGFSNVLLVAAQRPDATFVAGYQAWRAQGRHVRNGEPGIQVFAEPRAPSGRPRSPRAAGTGTPDGDGNRKRAERLTYVWDVAQTEGPPGADPAALRTAPGTPPGLWDALTWLARREGFAVERGAIDLRPGLTNWSTRRIRIRPGLGPPEAAQALIHELGHVLAHGRRQHQQGDTTAACRGTQKIEADSAAFIVATRLGMDTSGYSWPYVASWAGSDQRARPQETIRATGTRIATAANTITAHLDVTVFGRPTQSAADVPAATRSDPEPTSVPASGPPEPEISRVLLNAERFYRGHLDRSWVPGYLAARGFGQATVAQWRIGYAPAGWTALTNHLRGLGHDDAVIEASGLARRSSRGTLIDHFRDRAMLATRNDNGIVVGFIGRAHPDAASEVPKYLNSPETTAYTKGDLLFGLHEARDQLARGAVPVIAEGPFDAIAISAADPRQYVGLAPCGTALTTRQAAALARVADLSEAPVLVALDGDRAGREAAVKAYAILLTVTSKTTAITLPPGRDPAEILQADGPAALRDVLQNQAQPLAAVVIDAHLDGWADRLDHAEGQLHALWSAATLIASLLPSDTADQILQITGGHHLTMLDEDLHPVENPELPAIARLLPANAACQIIRVANRLETDNSEVTAEVANAVCKAATVPKRAAARGHQNDPGRRPIARTNTNPARMAAVGFPDSSAPIANPAPTPKPRPSIPSAPREIPRHRP